MGLTVDGKFFRKGDSSHFIKAVTYGPFPEEAPHRVEEDFSRIAAAGFNAVRIYSLPDRAALDQAYEHGLHLIPTLPWAHGCDFILDAEIFENARRTLTEWLAENHQNPGLGAVLVGNEIPSDMARWMGADRVREALDTLILTAKAVAPGLPMGYASFPTTEYLEPHHADFTAFNLYLEDEEKFRDYLPRLHHLAGDRPVLLSEFGLDTGQNPESRQAELIPAALVAAHEAGMAGFTVYAWSDHWFNNGEIVRDWSFGLVRRDLTEKPVLKALGEKLLAILGPPIPKKPPSISVIICTRNGALRLESCLAAATALEYPDFEVLVINDGSTDDTEAVLDRIEGIRVVTLPPCGLSAARNRGAQLATGEIIAFTDDDCQPDRHWLAWLGHTFSTTKHGAVGGPNLPPPTELAKIAVTACAPGAPTHVMLTDTEAEHLPGCNIAIRKEVFEKIDGFDVRFRTAGDDVDLCWRIREAGHTLGFSGAAFVWHDRRPTPWRYLKQQMGYGHAEALLYHKHPNRFTRGGRGGIRWEGCVYTGGALGVRYGDVIYAGPSGEAGYQSLIPRTQPLRPLPPQFETRGNRLALAALEWLQRHMRPWARHRHGGPPRFIPGGSYEPDPIVPNRRLTLTHHEGQGRYQFYQILKSRGWLPSAEDSFDLTKDGCHLIAATEQTGTRHARTFVRLHVAPGALDPLAELRKLSLSLTFTLS